jgi:hypothetical protein
MNFLGNEVILNKKHKPDFSCFFMVQFVSDVTKYISGCMASLSAMIQLELPHINILSKMDLVSNKKEVEEYAFFFFFPFIPRIVPKV